jgi:hypothetical protein
MIFDINDIAKIGSVQDIPGYQLPPEIWTLANNMRYSDEALIGMDGWGQVFGTPLYPPHFTMPVATSPTVYWLYMSLTKGAVFDGVTHTDITRAAGGDYTAQDSHSWNGTLFGNIAIVNNVNDVPQYWATPSTGTKLADLPNWPTGLRTRVMRSFGPFLVAVSMVESGVDHPHRLRWSHPAAPGTVPISWAVDDPSRDGGEIDFPDVAAGVLADALPLGSIMFVYKEASVWKMRFVGGQSKFDFGQSSWLTTAGLLSSRSVCITGDGMKHVMATQDDIIWHNGSKVQSVLSQRQRKRLQDEIDPTNFGTSFMFPNPYNNEVWFCYPRTGSIYPDTALIMNYKAAGGEEFAVTSADGIDFRNTAFGAIESFDPEIWNSGSDTWDEFAGTWGQLERRRVVLCNPVESKFFMLGSSLTRNGVPIVQTLTRDGLALIGKKRDGSPIVDHQKMKMLKRLWPKIIGDGVRVRFGAQQTVDGPIRWGESVLFVPASDVYCDPGPVSGRAVGFELTATSAVWRLDGYKIDMVPMGEF